MQYGNCFFEYVYVKSEGDSFNISCKSDVVSQKEEYALKYAKKVIAELSEDGKEVKINLKCEIPGNIISEAGKLYKDDEECYALEVTDNEINLYAPNHRGRIYAVSTLKQVIKAGELRKMVLFDYPDKQVRGYRVYTPGRDNFGTFKNMVDMLVEYKYNAINIEIGGAMEYKRHPEINEQWVKFCNEVHQSPNESRRIQFETHPQWDKNSIHADNGDGGYITQEEMRELVEYCRERELKVIPEVPTLSHCDYIVMTYRDLNERAEDTYPDTYCPSNPKSYEIVFDILDEVISVFEPEYVNIGHDEFYTVGICEKCRGKDPVELYVGDIVKINNYLKAKGIKTIMWSEKLWTNIYLPDENGVIHGCGGTGDEIKGVPRMEGLAGKIPMDVTFLQWYWSLCEHEEEKQVCDMGYSMIYGNFNAVGLKDYRKRISLVNGGFVSNWGSFEEMYMQRNGQNFSLLATAHIFWNKDYDTDRKDEVIVRVKEALYARYCKTLGSSKIEIVHTTEHHRPRKPFYDGYFIVDEEWLIGDYIVTYKDKTEAKLPVMFGYNIRACTEKESVETSEEAVSTGYMETIGAAFPFQENKMMYYKTSYANPYPEKEIESIVYKAVNGVDVTLCSYKTINE